jgi:protein-S-isoprenylcysteine O-methyltransferase Ste14
MTMNTFPNQSREKPPAAGAFPTLLLKLVLGVLAMAALIFVPAGRLDWVMGWAVVGLHLALFLVMTFVLRRHDPTLIAERSRVVTPDTKGWDKVVTLVLSLVGLGALILGGLDHRFGLSPRMPLAVQIAGLALAALGYSLFFWAMVSNKYFSRVVRIQSDRGHAVATDGPYRYVRHPGYVGFAVAWPSMALALGSLWGLIPGGLAAAAIVVRTALEDRTLQQELDGYREYASEVRYRLLPGVW